MKIALISGVTGQDGSYLAELLLNKGYKVIGLTRKSSEGKLKEDNIAYILPNKNFSLEYLNLADRADVLQLFEKIQPDEIYHLAGQKQSQNFDEDFGSFSINIDTTQFFLSAIKDLKPTCRFFFAGSSEMFGGALTSPQNESTPFNPTSPYAISKVAAFYLIKIYREIHGIFGCTGILFNHESPRRPYNYVTKKITSAAAKIKLGLEKELRLGNLDAKRDWGFAGDYVEAMWLMLQQEKSDDYIIGVGESHSIREFLDVAFGVLDLDWKKYVVVDKEFFRPIDTKELVANPEKAKKVLGWKSKTKFNDLIKMMVLSDLKALGNNSKAHI